MAWRQKCLMMDLIIINMQTFTSKDVNWKTGLESCGLLWCFYLLSGHSIWRHPFTKEDLLVRKWCNATFTQICNDKDLNVSTFSANLNFFGWTVYLRSELSVTCKTFDLFFLLLFYLALFCRYSIPHLKDFNIWPSILEGFCDSSLILRDQPNCTVLWL